jgi:hypothetical protein
LVALKGRQQASWSSGDYAVVGTTLQIVGEELCEALDLRAGQKLLDVAAGGNTAITCGAGKSPQQTTCRACWRRARTTLGRRDCVREAVPKVRSMTAPLTPSFDLGVMFTPNRSGKLSCCVFAAGRPNRPRKLDAGRLYRTNVQDP